jgi:peroxiredoxin Q/BCP
MNRRPSLALMLSLCTVAGGCAASNARPRDNGEARPATPRTPTAAEIETAAARSSPLVGKPAPLFTLPDADNKPVSLQALRGKWVVLYFYPMDDTPACTCQANEFTALLADFAEMNAEILGVSGDSLEDHQHFREKYQIALRLLSDPKAEMMSRYGAWVETKVADTVVGRTIRQTYLIDPQGNIARHWPEVVPQGHADRVRLALRDLQRAQRRS